MHEKKQSKKRNLETPAQFKTPTKGNMEAKPIQKKVWELNQFIFRSLNISCYQLQEKQKKIGNDENEPPGKRQRKQGHGQVHEELEKNSDDVDDEHFEPLKLVMFSISLVL